MGADPPTPMSHRVMVVGSEEGSPPNAWDPLWGREEPLKSLWGWGGGPQTWVPQGSRVGVGPQMLGTPPQGTLIWGAGEIWVLWRVGKVP